MFWDHKHKERPSVFNNSDRAIHLCSGGFYHDEKPISSSHQMLCLYPHEVDGDISFAEFALRCAGLILANYPFILESIIGCDAYSPDCYPLIELHRSTGRQFLLAKKNRLLATVHAPTLVNLISEYDRRFFECEFYSYREVLSVEQVHSAANDLRNSNFSLRIYYHECHDYFLIETSEDPSTCIKHIQGLCSREGRKLFL